MRILNVVFSTLLIAGVIASISYGLDAKISHKFWTGIAVSVESAIFLVFLNFQRGHKEFPKVYLDNRQKHLPHAVIQRHSFLYNGKRVTFSEWARDHLQSANLNVCPTRDNLERFYSFLAVKVSDLRVIQELLKLGVSANLAYGDYGSCTLMHFATQNASYDTFKALLEAGGDLKRKNWAGLTPYQTAELCQRSDIQSLILEKIVGNSCALVSLMEHGIGFAIEAVQPAKVIADLLDIGVPYDMYRGVMPLHMAIQSSSIETALMLIRRNVDINSPSAVGLTPLNVACICSEFSIIKELLSHPTIQCDWVSLDRLSYSCPDRCVTLILELSESARQNLLQQYLIENKTIRFFLAGLQRINSHPINKLSHFCLGLLAANNEDALFERKISALSSQGIFWVVAVWECLYTKEKLFEKLQSISRSVLLKAFPHLIPKGRLYFLSRVIEEKSKLKLTEVRLWIRLCDWWLNQEMSELTKDQVQKARKNLASVPFV